ncbi:Ig-like domain-containing protein [Lysinibacillus sp. JK80]|nr:Ig-like domain-containing protein [Lysinibacillus sp. JK80]
MNEVIENLKIGETKTLTVNVVPANATNKLVRWTSSDLNVATVNGQGK